MDPMRQVSRLFRVSDSEATYIPRPTQASLDDLYALGSTLGEVSMGTTFKPRGCEIKLHAHKIRGDFIYIRSDSYPTLKENLADVIQRAERVINFYQSM